MPIATRLTRLLGLEHPIVVAPMAGVSTPALAAAVSRAGALGSLAQGQSDARVFGEQLGEATRLAAGRPVAANVFCHAPPRRDEARERAWLDYLRPSFYRCGRAIPPRGLEEGYQSLREGREDLVAALLEARPAAVSFHFGVPPPGTLARFRRAGIATLASATSPAEASAAAAAGVSCVVLQGCEAGGHRGTWEVTDGAGVARDDEYLPAFELLQRVLDDFERQGIRGGRREPGDGPAIVLAGGLMTGADVARALRAGADGAQLGTAFIGCPEGAASEAHRARLGSDEAARAARLRPDGEEGAPRFFTWASGRAARGFVDPPPGWDGEGSAALPLLPADLLALPGPLAPEPPPLPDYPLPYSATRALAAAAAAAGLAPAAAPHLCGDGAPRALKGVGAAELVARLAAELEGALEGGERAPLA